KEMLGYLFEAGKLMEDIFWKQAYGNKEDLNNKISDPIVKEFVKINFGPWERLNNNTPFFDTIPKPAGANYYPVDMTKEEFETLAKEFIQLGKKLNIKVNCISTYANQPIGHCVGPTLEAKEALSTLVNGKGPADLVDKATILAGTLLEFSGKKNGQKLAHEILRSKKAYKKMQEIIEAQGGNPDIKPKDLYPGKKVAEFKSRNSGKILWMSNKAVDIISREAGTPKDKGAGIFFKKKIGDTVKKGETLFELYAEKTNKFNRAIELAHKLDVVKIGKGMGMMLEKLPEKREEHEYFILER
ncbi:MAG: hypothetical protein KAS04_01875, partial [Candidatus Aenigmarchaeota archaeon]|nr:hypothetical protein [Candidatus Aenigmarchaeota archaeon]